MHKNLEIKSTLLSDVTLCYYAQRKCNWLVETILKYLLTDILIYCADCEFVIKCWFKHLSPFGGWGKGSCIYVEATQWSLLNKLTFLRFLFNF